MKKLYAFVLTFCLLNLAGLASAQGTSVGFGNGAQDTDQPVEVTSDQLDVDQNVGTALFTGNVVVVQGEMQLAAPSVLVIYNEDQSEIDRIEATGGVTLLSGPDAAEGERADYTLGDGVILMTGDVLLTQGPNAITSDRMTVQLDDGTALMQGRVKSILQPKSNN
ncbi:MAG: lipopolysaccharide transport periplasmic protein LptA [Paracoccaceae bacterium]